jgi:hypothetical protein
MRLAHLCTCFVLALPLAAGCGDDDGGSDSGGGSDEDQITATIDAFAKGDSGSCDALTDEAAQDLFGGRDECEDAASDENDSADVDVADIQIDGDTATAKGTSGGDTANISLEKDGDEWKISAFEQAK